MTKIKQFPQLILQYLPSLIFLIVPLFFLTNTIDFFAFNKFYLLNVLTTIAITFWSIKNILENKISLNFSPATTGLFLLTLFHFLSTYFISPTKVLSSTGITTLFAAIFLVHLSHTSTKLSENKIQISLYSLLTSATLLSLVTIFHYFGLTKFFFPEYLVESKFFNLTGSVLSALTFTIPLIVGLITLILNETNTLKKTIYLITTSILATATTINILLILPSGFKSLNILPLNTSWSIALDIFKYPGTALVGTGPENFLSSFTRLRPVYLNLNEKLWNMRFSESGSLLLTLFTTTGLLGGLSLVYIYLKSIIQPLRLLKDKDKENKGLLSFFTASLLTYFILTIFTPMGIVSIITSLVIISIITQILKNENSSNIKTLHLNISSDGNTSTALSRFLPISVLIITITTLAIYWNFGSKFYLGSIKLHEANLAAKSDLGVSFQKQIEAQKLNQYDSTYSLLLSNTYQQVALFYLQKQSPTETDKKNSAEMMQRSIDAGRLAAKIDPFNVMVWENLSNIYQSFIGSADGATNLAISHLAQAISLDPTNPKLRLQLGILYYNLQDKEQAVKLINQAAELKPNWSLPYQNLYRIYLEEKDNERAKIYLQEAIKYLENNSEDFQKLQEELINLNQKTN
ncbi:hypothetical protein A2572_00220 [Candidatus Collierbacteria bacterium RIFOXYD1_FULL_40_9]|uniref:Uncharacterized protein n=1 Tax=Candidatus Collierbacteria bacterium RIFOXYD1_FULL_40_9 TaxID=1817731 RepID=A0A1F5FV34_9BACT|nr:MAG: hypothetical protein A2572_00220 [Candidatus Collierbacteria bacterium RIFOXYD1_FULL_40_9]